MTDTTPDFIDQWINLAQPRLGAEILSCSDDFFAECSRMLNPEPPQFIVGKFDDNGKWMDGWETRRRRNGGYDHAIVKLGLAGEIKGIDIDTTHFTGNYAPAASLEACYGDTLPHDSSDWQTLIPSTSLQGNNHHYFEIDDATCFNHIRLNIYPDGGVARLRVHGRVVSDVATLDRSAQQDLASVELGARAIACNDAHFGVVENLLNPGQGINMGDGWETARRRGPGNDWVILALGRPGVIERVEIDTAHFKGNYPDRASIEVATFADNEAAVHDSGNWQTLLPEAKLSMDQQHFFESELQDTGPVTHVRMSIYPDGGVSRLRLFGRASAGE